MASDYPLESVLAVTCGNLLTQAVLIDVVEGRYRLVARGEALSTLHAASANAMLGVARAISRLESAVGRKLLDDKAQPFMPERSDGNGVDTFLVTSSAGAPLRAFIIGLTADVSMQSARRAVSGGHARVVDSLSLEDGIDRREGIEAALQRFARAEAEVVVLVGGVDGVINRRVLDLAEWLALAYQASEQQPKPPIVYAGSADLAPGASEALSEFAEVLCVANVRPAMERENLAPLRDQIQKLFIERRLSRLPGMSVVAGWSRLPAFSSSQAQNYTLAYLSAHFGLNVVALDVGFDRATVSWAREGQVDVVEGGTGIGNGTTLVGPANLERILRWLPEASEPAEALQVILNQELFPSSVPGSRQEVLALQALAREALLDLMPEARQRWKAAPADQDPHWDMIILSGSTLARAPYPGQATLMTLDVLQPVGISSLVMDPIGLSPAMGALATIEPLAAAQVLEQDGFVSLGTVVAPNGAARPGEQALQVKVRYSDGRTLQLDVASGSLEIIPLGAGQKASLELRTGRHFDLGLRRTGRSRIVEVEGGALGVVIDARGRPLPTGQDVASSQEAVRRGLWDVGAA